MNKESNRNIKKIILVALFSGIGVFLAPFFSIPLGVAKAYPIQHMINIFLVILLGTRYAVSGAFIISLLRNLLGTGTILAFPGSMIGAFLAGIFFKKTKNIWFAIFGEILGTGIFGALLSYPIAYYILQSRVGSLFFVIPFMISSLSGCFFSLCMYYLVFLQKKFNTTKFNL